MDAVVLGWDSQFSYRKICMASMYLQNGAQFVVTNPDSADRMAGDRMQVLAHSSTAAALSTAATQSFLSMRLLSFSRCNLNCELIRRCL